MAAIPIVILGAGGHGKVVLDLIRAAGVFTPIGFLDADPDLAGTIVSGIPVLGDVRQLKRLRREQRVATVAIGIGDNRARRGYLADVREHGFTLPALVHPRATIASGVTLGDGAVVCAGAVVCVDATVGELAIINTGAIVDHECDIGPGAHVAPRAVLAGRVRVGAGAFVGLGACVIQCLSIGKDAVVGAGAVVLGDVPAGMTVVGVPARPTIAGRNRAARPAVDPFAEGGSALSTDRVRPISGLLTI